MVAMVYETLGRNPEFCWEDSALKARWRQSTLLQMSAQAVKTRRILEIAQALNHAGIPYAIVKGVVCRQMYAQRDLRPSGDEDMLIRSEDRQKCGELFQSLGFSYMQDMAENDVSHWADSRTGLHIELHLTLLPPDWEIGEVLTPYFLSIWKQKSGFKWMDAP